jgi:hypothetical protein
LWNVLKQRGSYECGIRSYLFFSNTKALKQGEIIKRAGEKENAQIYQLIHLLIILIYAHFMLIG